MALQHFGICRKGGSIVKNSFNHIWAPGCESLIQKLLQVLVTKYMSLYACAESLISICYYRCGPKKVVRSIYWGEKNELEILKTQEVKMGMHWRNGEEKKPLCLFQFG